MRERLLAGASGDVIEIGGGTGLNLPCYGPDVRSLTITEPEPPMLRRLERRVHEQRPSATVLRAPAEDLPFEDHSFDVAVSTLVLCGVDDQPRALRELRRVLRPGGRLLFIEHLRSEDPALARLQDRMNWLNRLVVRCDCNRPTLDSVRQAGFTVTEMDHTELPKHRSSCARPSWPPPRPPRRRRPDPPPGETRRRMAGSRIAPRILPMTNRLENTVALVTGSSSGIGAATARRLAAEGAAVALVARRRDRLDGLAAGIRADGGTALVVQADVTSQREAAGAVETAVAELGRLDTVVNNAGIMLLGPALDAPIGEWDQMVALNVQGMLYITHAALPHLVRAAADSPRQVADLVTITSTAGRVARPGSAVYNLTKFGAAAFSEALRQELIGRRVRVSVIEPGTVDTELASHLRDHIREAARSQTASIEPLRPDDIADTVAYIVTRDRRVAVNEMLVRAAEQTW